MAEYGTTVIDGLGLAPAGSSAAGATAIAIVSTSIRLAAFSVKVTFLTSWLGIVSTLAGATFSSPGLLGAGSEHPASPKAAVTTITAIHRPRPRTGSLPCVRMELLLMPGHAGAELVNCGCSAAAGPATPGRALAAIRKYRAGRTKRFTKAVVTRPPTMIRASGLTISRPAALP